MKKIADKGVTEIKLPDGTIPLVIGNELQFHGGGLPAFERVKAKFTLPSNVKWMRGECGELMKAPVSNALFVVMYEDAVNPFFQLNSKESLKKIVKIRKKVIDSAVEALKKYDVSKDKEMLKKCKWVCKVFRTSPTIIPTDEKPWKGHKGRIGACAFQLLGMIGG